MDNHIVLFDGQQWGQLHPLTLTRSVADLRVGMTSIADKWKAYLNGPVSMHTELYLRGKYPHYGQSTVLLINGALLPSPQLIEQLRSLAINQGLSYQGEVMAAYIDQYDINESIQDLMIGLSLEELSEVELISYPEDLLKVNDTWIKKDYYRNIRPDSKPLESLTTLIGPSGQLYIHPEATVLASSVNTIDGPVYIDQGAIVMEGSLLRGPLYIGNGSVIKMGAKIYGKTSIGPKCKIGGEIKRVIIQANTNKGHEGYLGDSVIGEWCNFGADSNNSNMKNNYGKVKLYEMSQGHRRLTDETFLGLFMGDHCRCAINTAFNTGTVASYFASIFGGAPSTFIRPFSWGANDTYDIEKAIQVAKMVHDRRDQAFAFEDEAIIRYLYQQYINEAN